MDRNAHAKPPQQLREIYKHFQKLEQEALDPSHDILNFSKHDQNARNRFRADETEWSVNLNAAFQTFSGLDKLSLNGTAQNSAAPKVVECKQVPGLFIFPNFLPPEIQLLLLDKLLHRDLSNPVHQTNIHMHYDMSYPQPSGTSFFAKPSSPPSFTPKDHTVHKPLTLDQVLQKKLRWLTLGGQYDWTAKRYPESSPPDFPPDVKKLLEDLFPMLKAEAAIVNLYSPGDTLSLHRDVSEECDRPLVSVSLGCDGVFIIGLETGDSSGSVEHVAVRLRSGDAVVMSGRSRYAWHGVPKVVKETCPEWMRDWPARREEEGNDFEDWKGWMEGKRINLNVRQMFA